MIIVHDQVVCVQPVKNTQVILQNINHEIIKRARDDVLI